MNRIYGWKRDIPDHRDFIYKAKVYRLPTAVDLEYNCSPVENQLNLGSCTANALVGVLEFNEPKDSTFQDLSRLFIYYNERLIEHTVDSDAGAMIRDGIKALAKAGVCPESEWPYDVTKFAVKPPTSCYKDALKRKISSYERLDNLYAMKQCLTTGFPFAFGFTVYESFESARVAKTGIAPYPSKNERPVGGHAVCAVGFDDKKKALKVRNSWGADWGIKGYFWLPYAFIENGLADDAWTIRK